MIWDNEQWIPWEGGENPLLPGVVCEALLRRYGDHKPAVSPKGPTASEEWAWWSDGSDADIIAYRVKDKDDEP